MSTTAIVAIVIGGLLAVGAAGQAITDCVRSTNEARLTAQRECIAAGMSFVSTRSIVACLDKEHSVEFKRGLF